MARPLGADGRTNKEIARTVFLSEKTAEGHLSRVFTSSASARGWSSLRA